jgi:hypothetical protein
MSKSIAIDIGSGYKVLCIEIEDLSLIDKIYLATRDFANLDKIERTEEKPVIRIITTLKENTNGTN